MRVSPILLASLLLVASCAEPPDPETADVPQTAAGEELFARAIDAIGGRERLAGVDSLVLEGTGSAPNLGQNRTPDDELPVWEVTAFRREIYGPEAGMRTRQVREARFPFALATTQRQDNGIAAATGYTVRDDGERVGVTSEASAALRREFLRHPLTLLATIVGFGADFGEVREVGGTFAMDLVTGQGDMVTLEVAADTGLPKAIISRESQANLGDVEIRTTFSGYTDVDGMLLPSRLTTTIDRFLQLDLEVSNRINGVTELGGDPESLGPDFSLPPAPSQFSVTVNVERVADGIWWLAGSGNHRSILFEFEDHLTLFEVPASQARTQSVILTARTLVPEKPLTHAIVSHHHFDHSAGLRAAVAEGLTIIAHRSNVEFFEELVSRPHTRPPDVLARSPRDMVLEPIDDMMVLEDSTMRVELYHTLDNPREGTNIFAYVPRERMLVQADLYDSGWTRHPWADNFRANIAMRGLDVERHVPVHGTLQTDAEVLETLRMRGAAY